MSVNNYIENDLYREILGRLPIACVDIAIVWKGGVLLVKRGDAPAEGQWWLPGGRVLKGEMMKDTATRKAREEVGVDCHVGPLVHTAETIFPDGPGGIPVHSINSCFFLYPVNEKIKVCLDEHSRDWRWIRSIEEGLHPYVEQCLLGAGLSREPVSDI